MAFSQLLISFLSILKESITLLPKNGKLMGLIAISSMLLNSVAYLLFNYSLQSLLTDMFAALMQSVMPDPSADPATPFDSTKAFGAVNDMKHYLALIFTVVIACIIVVSIISLFFVLATIIVAAYSYNERTLSLKELFGIMRKTWMRQLITALYVSALAMGYFLCFVALTLPLTILFPNPFALIVVVVVWIVASVLYFYLVVPWILAIFVSILEDGCYGTKALTRASTLVEGNRVHGFLLILCLNIVGVIVYQGFSMILGKTGSMNPTVYGLFVTNVTSLMKILLLVAYAVLYFQCKKNHGEGTEVHGSSQYTKLSTHLVNDV